MLRFKDGVSIFGLQPEILWALDKCVQMWMVKYVTVTSARGGTHSRKSLHYAGHAVDLRNNDMTTSQRQETLISVREILGVNYDFLDEGDHFHLEYQPKMKTSYPMDQPYA